MKEDQSFGVIVVQKGTENKFLLLKQINGNWSFPKGHKEGDESPLQSALRELKEEAGIESCEISTLPIISEEYTFTDQNGTWHKTVEYFIGFASDDIVVIQEKEIREYRWATYTEAMELFEFEEARQVLKEAKESLAKM